MYISHISVVISCIFRTHLTPAQIPPLTGLYQKKEEGSKNVNLTELERFPDKIKFLFKIC